MYAGLYMTSSSIPDCRLSVKYAASRLITATNSAKAASVTCSTMVSGSRISGSGSSSGGGGGAAGGSGGAMGIAASAAFDLARDWAILAARSRRSRALFTWVQPQSIRAAAVKERYDALHRYTATDCTITVEGTFPSATFQTTNGPKGGAPLNCSETSDGSDVGRTICSAAT